jgi:hypothetical protein
MTYVLIDDIKQSVRTWFMNEAHKIVRGDVAAPAPPKRDKRAHPTGTRSWTPKSVCGSIFSNRVSDVQLRLSGGGEHKDFSQYSSALKEVFGKLSEEERKECDRLCDEWNASAPAEDVQRK